MKQAKTGKAAGPKPAARAAAPKEDLFDDFAARISHLHDISWKPMFGYQCGLVNNKFFVGLRDAAGGLVVLLRLSPEDAPDALEHPDIFSKYPFGKTWVRATAGNRKDLADLWPWVQHAYRFVDAQVPDKAKKHLKPRTR